MPDAVTADEVLRHLGEVDYPADEDAMLAAAELVRSLRLDPAPHAEPGQQARTPAPPGVSQASRAPQEDRVAGEDRRSV